MKRSSESGFTIIEMAVATVIFVFLTGAFVMSLGSMRRLGETSEFETRFQVMGTDALEQMIDDLRISGFVRVAGLDYPHLFDDGDAQGAFAAHWHTPALKEADPDDFDFGPNREIVFVMPADADGNGVPDIDGSGSLVWSPDEISYVLLTRNDGVNYIERRVNAGAPEIVASHVERLVFDDATTAVELPLGAIRIRMYFRERDGTGTGHRYFVEVTTRLRNG